MAHSSLVGFSAFFTLQAIAICFPASLVSAFDGPKRVSEKITETPKMNSVLPLFRPAANNVIRQIKKAGTARFSVIDQHVLNTPAHVERSITALAKYLVKPAKTEREKVRAIYRWVTDRIEYDVESYFGGKMGPHCWEAEPVLRRKKGVCCGYARLFAKLCQAASMECVEVSGYAKGVGFVTGVLPAKTNHSWNAVRIGEIWHLVDATWGAGHLNDKKYVKQFREFFFLTPPDDLIFSHAPEDKKWQLLAQPLTLSEWIRLPDVSCNLFEYGISGEELRERFNKMSLKNVVISYHVSGLTAKITYAPLRRKLNSKEKITIRVKSPNDVKWGVINNRRWRYFKKSGDTFSIEIEPREGFLKVSARVPGKGDDYWTMLEYEVK